MHEVAMLPYFRSRVVFKTPNTVNQPEGAKILKIASKDPPPLNENRANKKL